MISRIPSITVLHGKYSRIHSPLCTDSRSNMPLLLLSTTTLTSTLHSADPDTIRLGLALIRYFRNRSMQPETQQAPQQALLEQITSLDSDNTFQHGSQIQSGISLQSAVQDDASLATGDCATVSGANARRLSQEGNASSFKSRVEEYERSSSPPKAVDNLVFKVAPNAASDPNVCSISQVPNGQ